MNITKEELVKILGLGEDATDEQILTAIKAGAQAVEELAIERTKAENAETEKGEAKTEAETAKAEAETAKAELENEKTAHEATKTALANEIAAKADMALDAAVREKRIGEGARATWKERLVKEGAAAYTALANEKAPPATDATKGLVNECDGEKSASEKRVSMVNEIMTKEKIPYLQAWAAAKDRAPDLFKTNK